MVEEVKGRLGDEETEGLKRLKDAGTRNEKSLVIPGLSVSGKSIYNSEVITVHSKRNCIYYQPRFFKKCPYHKLPVLTSAFIQYSDYDH
jgi:hypothetical protein